MPEAKATALRETHSEQTSRRTAAKLAKKERRKPWVILFWVRDDAEESMLLICLTSNGKFVCCKSRMRASQRGGCDQAQVVLNARTAMTHK